jgi:hypothetical protein
MLGRLDRFSLILNRGLAIIAGISLVAMVTVTVGEMVLRMFARPMAGTVETIGWLAAVTTAFALGYTQVHQGHVSIDLFIRRLGSRSQSVLGCLVCDRDLECISLRRRSAGDGLTVRDYESHRLSMGLPGLPGMRRADPGAAGGFLEILPQSLRRTCR